jgi:transposase
MTCPKGALPQPLDATLRAKAKTMWESGTSYGEISSQLSVNVSSLKNWKSRDKWTRAESSNELAVAAPGGVDNDVEIPEDLQEQASQYESDMRVAALKFSNHVKNLSPAELTAKAQHVKNLDGVHRKALRIETEKPSSVIQIAVLAKPMTPAEEARCPYRSGEKLVEAPAASIDDTPASPHVRLERAIQRAP